MVCCVVPGIDQEDLQKQSNAPCRHCGDGCRIYDTRPGVCRNFFCAWRYLADWDDSWRPDLSGVFARIEPSTEGAWWALGILLTERPEEIARSEGFATLVAGVARKGTPVFLGLAGPPGCLPVRVRLPAAALDMAIRQNQLTDLLQKAVSFLRAQPISRHIIGHTGNDITAEPPSGPARG